MPNLRGRVVDAATKQPIARAQIHMRGRDGVEERIEADELGRYAVKGATRSGGPHMVPTIYMAVSAPCYKTDERLEVMPPYNSIHPPQRADIELERQCSTP